MKEEIRRAIVSSAITRIRGQAPSYLYSYERGRHTPMAKGYDYESGAHFTDTYHYGTGSYINLNINGETFQGYAYGDGYHFTGTVNGSSVTIYDYGEGRYFNYSA